MSKVLLLFAVLNVLITCNMGWVRLIEHIEGSEGKYTGHCHTNEYDIGSLEKNESVRLKTECAIAECRENKDIHISGCGMVRVQPPCELLPGDMSKPYPDCCYEIICPENNIL